MTEECKVMRYGHAPASGRCKRQKLSAGVGLKRC